MFFSYQILISKNSNFAIIWRYLHDRYHTKFSKKDLLAIDINKACDDLRSYIPTGDLSKSEVQNKMSLYLLGQLLKGITLVHDVQWDFLLADLEALAKSFMRFPEEEGREKKRRKSGTRKRKTVDELGGELDWDEEEEEEGRKRRKTLTKRKSVKRASSILDLNDVNAYVDFRVPVRAPPVIDEGEQLDDMFTGYPAQPLLPPPEWGKDEEPRREGAAKVSLFSLGVHVEDSMFKELEWTLSPTFQPITPMGTEPSGIEVPLGESGPTPVYRVPSEPIEGPELRRGFELDELCLDDLPELVPTPRAPKRRRQRIGFDDETELTNQEILAQMHDYHKLVRTLDDLRREIEAPEKVPIEKLFDPRPLHIKGLSKELHPLFETALMDYQERPLAFGEAQRITWEDMHIRRFGVDIPSLNLATPEQDVTVGSPQSRLQRTEEESFGGERRPEKVSMALLAEERDQRASSALLEEMRFDLGDMRTSTAPPPFEPIQPDFGAVQQDLMDYGQFGDQQSLIIQESVWDKSSPGLPEEGWVDAETEQMGKDVATAGLISFKELAQVDKLTKAQVARKFFTLLKLLKDGKVKARQPTGPKHPFAEILVRQIPSAQQQKTEEGM